MLRPYWPMSERLAITTRDLLSAHSRLYETTQPLPKNNTYMYDQQNRMNNNILPPNQQPNKSPDMNSANLIPASSYPAFVVNNNNHTNNNLISPVQQDQLQQQQQLPLNTQTISNDIDFNSCEFLYDSALFGQIIFDNANSSINNNKYLNSGNLNYDFRPTDLMYQQQQQ